MTLPKPPGRAETLAAVLDIIECELEWPMDRKSTTETTKLGEEGLGLDSIMLIDAGIYIEGKFGISIPDEDIFELAKRSVGELADYIDGRRSS